jgi:hypothetical protein
MRIDKKIGVRVTVHKGGKFLGSRFDHFESIEDVKSYVRSSYKKNGIVYVSVSQDGGYHKSFNMNTN